MSLIDAPPYSVYRSSSIALWSGHESLGDANDIVLGCIDCSKVQEKWIGERLVSLVLMYDGDHPIKLKLLWVHL